ncbi:MAG: EamA family transporter [Thermoproteota archaeon]
MLWLALSLLSALAQSSRDLLSKSELQELDEYILAFSRNFFSLSLLIPLLFITGIPEVGFYFWLVTGVNSILFSAASVLYMRAIKLSPLSLTVPMLAFTPLFLLLTSPLIVGEFPNYPGLIGILFIVSGTYVLSIKDVKKGYLAPFKALGEEKGALVMLVVAVLFSLGANLFKIGIQQTSPLYFLTMFYVLNSGITFLLILTQPRTFKTGSKINLKVLLGIGVFNALMEIFVATAMQTAIVPYVISLKRTTILLSTFYGYLFFKEERIKERLTGALTMFLGILLIGLS